MPGAEVPFTVVFSDIPAGAIGPDTKVIDAKGMYLAPGFLDAHIHIESSMLSYTEFAKMVVKHGTTAVATDLMEVTIVSGIDGMKEVLAESKNTPVKLYYPIPAFMEEISAAENHCFHYVIVHEQYFYEDYERYEPDYRERVFATVDWCHRHGYRPVTMTSIINEISPEQC